ncbi:MAG: WhiB family transcriptional regulator [Ilumatobacteraceae bacterium]
MDDPLAELLRWLEPDWQRDSLCRDDAYRHLNWFPEKGETIDKQRDVCGRCLVRVECYQMAQDGREQGVWAGTSAKQRRALRRAPAAA